MASRLRDVRRLAFLTDYIVKRKITTDLQLSGVYTTPDQSQSCHKLEDKVVPGASVILMADSKEHARGGSSGSNVTY